MSDGLTTHVLKSLYDQYRRVAMYSVRLRDRSAGQGLPLKQGRAPKCCCSCKGVYNCAYKCSFPCACARVCVGVLGHLKIHGLRKISLKITQERRNDFYERMYVLISIFYQIPTKKWQFGKKNNNISKPHDVSCCRLRSARSPAAPSEPYLRASSNVCPRRARTETASQPPLVRSSRDLTRETLILIYLLLLLQCTRHLPLSLFAEQLGGPSSLPQPGS